MSQSFLSPTATRSPLSTRPIVIAFCFAFACISAAADQSVSTAELDETTPVPEPSLGGEASVSPLLVPMDVLSLEELKKKDADAHRPSGSSPSKRVAARPDRGPTRRERQPLSPPPLRTHLPAGPRLSPDETATRSRIRRTLQAYEGWHLNSRDHSPWEVMHAIIARGVDAHILDGGPGGRPVTAVGWLCFNKPAGGRRLLYLSHEGFGTLQGPGLEGHRGQFLAVLAQARVKPDYPLEIQGRSFTVADLIEYEKRTCYPGTELTFKLIALNHYLDQDAEWTSEQGQQWNIPRLIHEEITQPIRGATCGGTHRLAGLSLAVRRRVFTGEPLDGEYARAAKYIRDYHAYTFKLQNRDGSLSTEFFRGRGADPDPARRLRTTGHILEWLCYSLPDAEIRSDRVRAAVDYLADLMWQHRNRTWDAGPLGHALHALSLYDERVFQPQQEEQDWQSAAAAADATADRTSR